MFCNAVKELGNPSTCSLQCKTPPRYKLLLYRDAKISSGTKVLENRVVLQKTYGLAQHVFDSDAETFGVRLPSG
ncbi:hypothetical protein Barb6_01543 [Bacteroidales bacterium Barb6]|nr:hypothetical protein Barb6_01543 [Bacteroidales bacterium Barb6]